MNRIPVNVNVNSSTAADSTAHSTNHHHQEHQEHQQKFSSSSEYRSSSSSSSKLNNPAGAAANNNIKSESTTYNMRNMNDETDRIRERMREFEEHCRRVREQAFANRPTTTTSTTTNSGVGGSGGGFFTDFGGATSGFDQRVPSSSFVDGSPGGSRFSSSMHRSSIEDMPDGNKKYRIEFDIGDFYQNELNIATNGKTLVVRGEREQKVGSATETKTFNRELTLPDYVDVDRMSAFLLNNNTANSTSSTSQFR